MSKESNHSDKLRKLFGAAADPSVGKNGKPKTPILQVDERPIESIDIEITVLPTTPIKILIPYEELTDNIPDTPLDKITMQQLLDAGFGDDIGDELHQIVTEQMALVQIKPDTAPPENSEDLEEWDAEYKDRYDPKTGQLLPGAEPLYEEDREGSTSDDEDDEETDAGWGTLESDSLWDSADDDDDNFWSSNDDDEDDA